MKYTNNTLRMIYHQFVIYSINELFLEVLNSKPDTKYANSIIGYGYYDENQGMMLEVIAFAYRKEQDVFLSETPLFIRLSVPLSKLIDYEFYPIDHLPESLLKEYAHKTALLNQYLGTPILEQIRSYDFLDLNRDLFYMDHIQVLFIKEDESELLWCKVIGIGNHEFKAVILDQLKNKWNLYKGMNIRFYIQEMDKKIKCICNVDKIRYYTFDDLADGSVLEEAITLLNTYPNSHRNYLDVIEIIRDSYFWVPCHLELSEEDEVRLERILRETEYSFEGLGFEAKDDIQYIPDLIGQEDGLYLPIFSSLKQMGIDEEDHENVQMNILEIIELAKNNQVDCIALNPFTDAFIMEEAIWLLLEDMESNLQTAN